MLSMLMAPYFPSDVYQVRIREASLDKVKFNCFKLNQLATFGILSD